MACYATPAVPSCLPVTTQFLTGFDTRAATPSDLQAVAALVAAAELDDIGEAFLSADDIQVGWNRSEFNLDTDSVLVYDGDQLVAWAEVCGGRADVAVLPPARGRGIGTELLAWTERRAANQEPTNGKLTVGQTLPNGAAGAVSLLADNGYSPTHTSWALSLPDEVLIEMPPLPDGVVIRPYRRGSEERATYQVVEDAFNEWPGRVPMRFEQWQTWVTERPNFDESMLLVAADNDEIVGVGLGLEYEDEGWVEQLAVRADRRGEGLAKALLSTLFSMFRQRQYSRMGISTDSRTGALDLYVGLGMVVDYTFTRYTKEL